MKRRLVDTLVWLGIFLVGGLLAVFLAYPALAQGYTTLTVKLCHNENETLCIEEVVTDSSQHPDMTLSGCQSLLGMYSALKFANEHPLYSRHWHYTGWQCMHGNQPSKRSREA